MNRPSSVHIDDFAAPEFSAEIAAMMDAVAPLAATIRLEPAVVCAEAERRSGLHDFGPERFREPLAVFCRAVQRAGLSPFGLVSTFEYTVSLLVNRLRVHDLLARHPEIHAVPITAPVIICGQPRTGTTHLHNLIASDARWRSLPYWESVEPVLSADEAAAVAAGAPDPRPARAATSLAALNTMMPLFVRMHEMTADAVHEEIALLANEFCTQQIEALARMPEYRDWYLAADQLTVYRSLRTMLQVCTFLRPDAGTRWVLKTPQHTERIRELVDVFPDATFVVTHRDPVAVTASVCTMLAYLERSRVATPDAAATGRYWADRMVQMFRDVVRDRDLLPPERTLDVHFDDFMRDDIATVARIYEIAGQPFDAAARAAMDAFMAEHPRGKHGGIEYDLAQLGLDKEELRARTAFYVERFGIDIEPGWA